MPDWNMSIVTNMNGWNGAEDTDSYIGFGGKTHFNGNISNWNTAQVTSMERLFYKIKIGNLNSRLFLALKNSHRF
jgi:surface protein